MLSTLWVKRTFAWSVHLLTASGALWGFLAILAIFEQNWRAAVLWMALAIFVDGVDGYLARLLNVKTYANGIDGALLDNMVDYLNYVVVPALFLYQAELLPPAFALLGSTSILLTSAYQFTQWDAKTEDHYFKGFPSYWNVMAMYMLALRLNPWVNLAFLAAFNVLVFVPFKYVYPTRYRRLQRVTIVLTYIWGISGLWAVLQYPNVPMWVLWSSFAYIVYYVALSFLPQKDKTTA
ncbi:MAG: CDP-alcohol phosphatidyltransferase family protein [Anaerolineales bacterium]